MADKKISQLNSVTLPLDGTEQIPIVQNVETKKVTLNKLRNGTFDKSVTESVSGVYPIEFPEASNYNLTLTGNTTLLNDTTPPLGFTKTLTIYVIGDFSLTLPVEWDIKNGGVYDGINGSQIVVQYRGNGEYYTVINNEQ